jgi:hypothetical protein
MAGLGFKRGHEVYERRAGKVAGNLKSMGCVVARAGHENIKFHKVASRYKSFCNMK